ncbi:hypothetical protein D3C78_1133470 [compost metagenome]
MRQPGEGAQAGQHRLERQAHGTAERQSREGVGLVVRTANLQFADRHQLIELEGQPLLAALLDQAERLEIGFVGAKGPARNGVGDQRPAQRIGAIHHHLLRATEDTVLGQVVIGHAVVAVHMVFADVQAGGDRRVQALAGFQLEAGQFQYIQLDVIGQQIERRGAEVAAHCHALAGRCGHLTNQSGDSALGVGAGDGDDRRLGMAGEQVDIARHLHTACSCSGQRRRAQRQAGAHIKLAGTAEELDIEFAATHFHLRVLRAQGSQLWRTLPRIGDGERHTQARQEAHQRHAALAEADNDAEVVRGDQAHTLAALNAVSTWPGRSARESP